MKRSLGAALIFAPVLAIGGFATASADTYDPTVGCPQGDHTCFDYAAEDHLPAAVAAYGVQQFNYITVLERRLVRAVGQNIDFENTILPAKNARIAAKNARIVRKDRIIAELRAKLAAKR